jgi:hypothetical protein
MSLLAFAWSLQSCSALSRAHAASPPLTRQVHAGDAEFTIRKPISDTIAALRREVATLAREVLFLSVCSFRACRGRSE